MFIECNYLKYLVKAELKKLKIRGEVKNIKIIHGNNEKIVVNVDIVDGLTTRSKVLVANLKDKSLSECFGNIYEYLYERDTSHNIVNVMYPIYEQVLKENKDKAIHFQKDIIEVLLLDSDREYATAAITMCLYDEDVRSMVEKANLMPVVNMVLANAL